MRKQKVMTNRIFSNWRKTVSGPSVLTKPEGTAERPKEPYPVSSKVDNLVR